MDFNFGQSTSYYGVYSGQFTPVQTKRKIINEDDEPENNKKVTSDHIFTIRGEYEDEITMEFSDNKQLYVSKMFLCHISPVFAAMFEKKAKYVENKEKKIKMEGKRYDHVLELLLQVHPRIQKEVNLDTVFKIVPLAEEYMIDGSITKCRLCLMDILKKQESEVYLVKPLEIIVNVLVTASCYRYNDIRQYARKILSRWDEFNVPKWLTLYDKIPDDDKLKILEMRLKKHEDAIMIHHE